MEVACYAKCSMFSNPTKTEDTRHEPNQHDVIMSGSACVATEDIHCFFFFSDYQKFTVWYNRVSPFNEAERSTTNCKP